MHIAEGWYRKTALGDLPPVRPERVHRPQLYQGLDQLLKHKNALETHIKASIGELFALDNDLWRYGVTSTYFEWQASGDPTAKRARSGLLRGTARGMVVPQTSLIMLGSRSQTAAPDGATK